jgi:hypothetical protein
VKALECPEGLKSCDVVFELAHARRIVRYYEEEVLCLDGPIYQLENGDGEVKAVDIERLGKVMRERDAYRAFYEAWERCEGNRGRYSCSPEHDCRCEYQMKSSGKCVCGSEQLQEADRAVVAIRGVK